MTGERWEAVARIMLYGFRVGYFPLRLSPVFLLSALFGENHVSKDLLLSSFKLYISTEERDIITQMLDKYDEENEDALLETLSSYNCYRKPSKESLLEIVHELSHQELIQKPRYVANCMSTEFGRRKHPFTNKEALHEFYKEKSLSSRKVIKCLDVSPENDSQRSVVNHVHRFIKSRDKRELATFMRFITGSDIMPEINISVVFVTQLFRAPIARSCVPMLELADTYTCYNELAEEFSAVLNNQESFQFSFI